MGTVSAVHAVPPPSESPEGLPSLRGRFRKPTVMGPWLAVGVMVIGFFAMLWAFSGFLAKNSGLSATPGLVEITVDGTPLSRNTHPDVVSGTIDVPAGSVVDFLCSPSVSRAVPTFRLRAGGKVQEAGACRFTAPAPATPGESAEATIEVMDSATGAVSRSEKVVLHAVDARDHLAVTHIVPADAAVDAPDAAQLQVAHRSTVVGKLFTVKAPANAESLRALVFVGKLGDHKHLQLAVDMDALSHGDLVPIAPPLTRYRSFGAQGAGFVFETKLPVWIGDAADSTQAFQILALVVEESAVAGIVAQHLSTKRTSDGRLRLAVRGFDVEDLRRVGAGGWVSDDVRVIRAPANAKGLPQVIWTPVAP